MPGIVTGLRRRAGIDRAVGFALLGRGWGALAGIVTLGFLVRFLTPRQQGYYSTFGSFMALQVFFELGLSLVLMQFASHERAGLEWTPQRTLAGDPVAKARLASLLRRGVFWYGVMSLAVLALIYPVGMVYFSIYGTGGAPVDWKGPWLFLSVGVAGGLLFTPLWAILEGSGLVAEVVEAQFVGGIINSLLFWLMLLLHWKLYAAPIGGLASTAWVIIWLVVRQRGFLLDLWGAAKPGVEVDWRREIWPFQWKIALSWLSGYFIFRLFNPLLFAALGPVNGPIAAGQMGLSMGVMSAIAAIALGWISTKAAPFGSLVARRDWAQMDRMFFPCLWQSTVVLVVGETAFWLLTLYLHHIGYRLSGRLLAPLPLALLLASAVSSHIVSAEAIYLRAHKQEPFLVLSLVVGCLTALSSFLLVRPFGAEGMMAGYLVVSLIGLVLGSRLFVQKRREWHTNPPDMDHPAAPGDRPHAPAVMEMEPMNDTAPPVLSLCIPTYKRAALLDQALRAVLGQVTPDMTARVEVIVLDNASPDHTPAVVQEAQADFPHVPLRYVRRPQNIGPDRNFTDALTRARGEFLYLLSDDDVLLPGAVAKLLELIRRHPDFDAFALNVRLFRDSPEEVGTPQPFTLEEDLLTHSRDEALALLSTHLVFLSSMAFRRANVVGRDYTDKAGTVLIQAFFFVDALAPGRGFYATRQPFLAQRAENAAGYNFFRVFVTNFDLVLRYARRNGYSQQAVDRALTTHLHFIYQFTLIFKSRGHYDGLRPSFPDALFRVLRTYRFNRFSLRYLVPRMLLPQGFYRLMQRLTGRGDAPAPSVMSHGTR